MNALQPVEAKRKGGETAGTQAAMTGRLQEAAERGVARSRTCARFHPIRGSRPAASAMIEQCLRLFLLNLGDPIESSPRRCTNGGLWVVVDPLLEPLPDLALLQCEARL